MVVVTKTVAVQLARVAPLGGAEYFPSTVPNPKVLGNLINEHEKQKRNENGMARHEHA